MGPSGQYVSLHSALHTEQEHGQLFHAVIIQPHYDAAVARFAAVAPARAQIRDILFDIAPKLSYHLPLFRRSLRGKTLYGVEQDMIYQQEFKLGPVAALIGKGAYILHDRNDVKILAGIVVVHRRRLPAAVNIKRLFDKNRFSAEHKHFRRKCEILVPQAFGKTYAADRGRTEYLIAG